LFVCLFVYLFTVLCPAPELFTYMETSQLAVKGLKSKPMLGAQGLWAGMDLYRATPAVTRDLEGLPHLVAYYETQGVVEDQF
jgi:hypothetical protein